MGTKGMMPTRAHINREHPHLTGPKTALQKNQFSFPAQHWPVLLCPVEGKDQSQPTGLKTQRQQQRNSCVFSINKSQSFSRWRSKCSCSYKKSKKLVKYIKINLYWKNISRGNWMNPLPQKTQLWSLKSFSKFKLTTSNRYSPLQPFLYPRNLT